MMNHSPLVSVVMPVYNGERYLPQAVESILGQSFADLECLIVDDASTDGSRDIEERYQRADRRVAVLRHSRNEGVGASLNDGLQQARGKFIARMDSDDISYPGRFEAQVEFLESHEDVGLLGTNLTLVSENGSGSGEVSLPETDSQIRFGLLFNSVFAHPSVMFRAEIIRKFTLAYDEVHEAEDYTLWAEFARVSNLHIIQHALLGYRLHPAQASLKNQTAMFECANQLSNQLLEEVYPQHGLSWSGKQRIYGAYLNVLKWNAELVIGSLDLETIRLTRTLLSAFLRGRSCTDRVLPHLLETLSLCSPEPRFVFVSDDGSKLEPAAGPQAGLTKLGIRPATQAGPLGPANSRNTNLPKSTAAAESPLTVSVVVNTCNRAQSLDALLRSLRRQNYPHFEVIVVNGPSTDNTTHVLDRWKSSIRVGTCSDRNLSVSRNVGIEMARGDLVAFIDDDAEADENWLSDAAAAFDAEEVGGAGGVIFDHTGYNVQYRYTVCDRLGNAYLDRQEPANEFSYPGCLRYPNLQGGNAVIRRDALLAIGGFDEEFDYFLDETDVCLRLIDAGYLVKQLPNAFVYHRSLPGHVRDASGAVTGWRPMIKNKVYFGLKNSPPGTTILSMLQNWVQFASSAESGVESLIASKRLEPRALQKFHSDAETALREGIGRGLGQPRRFLDSVTAKAMRGAVSRDLWSSADAPEFKPCPVVLDAARKMNLCLLRPAFDSTREDDGPALAHGLARRGHIVHVLTQSACGRNTVSFENDVWVHRLAPADQVGAPPEGVALPLRVWQDSVAMLRELHRIHSMHRIDLVDAASQDAHTTATALDGSFRIAAPPKPRDDRRNQLDATIEFYRRILHGPLRGIAPAQQGAPHREKNLGNDPSSTDATSANEASALYKDDFYRLHLPMEAEYVGIADSLRGLLNFDSVLDLGCGNGFVLRELKQAGKRVCGVEGSSHAFPAMADGVRDLVLFYDLTRPLFISRFDLVMCTEVAEHLPAESADTLIDTICKQAVKYVYFTAATPGQGGQHHVNEQPHRYWIEKFAERGCPLDLSLTQKLRERLNGFISQAPWFVANSMIFRVTGSTQAATSEDTR